MAASLPQPTWLDATAWTSVTPRSGTIPSRDAQELEDRPSEIRRVEVGWQDRPWHQVVGVRHDFAVREDRAPQLQDLGTTGNAHPCGLFGKRGPEQAARVDHAGLTSGRPDRLGDRVHPLEAGPDRRLVDDEGAHAVLGPNQTERLEVAQRRADRRAGHPEGAAQLALGGQSRALAGSRPPPAGCAGPLRPATRASRCAPSPPPLRRRAPCRSEPDPTAAATDVTTWVAIR